MGQAKRNQTATQSLIAKYPDCCLCGGARPSATRDHIPPKALFDNSYRPNDIVIPACNKCNNGTSTSDLVASLVARWRYSSGATELADHNQLVRQLRRQAPEIITEWTKLGPFERMGAKLHLYEQGIMLPPDAGIATIGPTTIPHLNLFAHKLTLGLYFWHFDAFLPSDGVVEAYWRTKEDFIVKGIPEDFLEIFSKHDFLKQGGWSERETFEYRYSKNEGDGLFGCFARCRGGFFVVGFAAADASSVVGTSDNWIRPIEVLSILDNPKYRDRH
jgi:hypothetical protein